MSALLLLLSLATVAAPPQSPPELRREALMGALRNGGYTVILRHARTDRSFQEVREYVPKERSAQRNLTDEGVRDAALMGAVFRKHGVAFAEILASPMYRTVETAEMVAGKPDTTMLLRVFPSTAEQAALVARAPRPGANRLVVTHHFVIETHVPGIRPGEIGESEAVVVRHPGHGAVELVGRITLDDWRALATPVGTPNQAAAPAPAAPREHVPPHAIPAGHTRPDSSRGPVATPDTHAGHIAREYITAFNSGDRATMRAFLDAWMMPNPDRPLDERLDTYLRLFAEHGTLTVTAVELSGSTEVTLGMRGNRGSFRMTVTSSEAQPMRATSITFTFLEGSHR
jgi:phosphohistidine phosphatase SixA